jgi:RNA polymerase sigma-70 factor (ECF subfamily)
VEDILQESYERWHKQNLNNIENPQAFLTTVVSRLCIDQLRKHQQRQHYTGSGLPEPLYDDELSHTGPFEIQSTYQSLSLAFLLLLEHLNPTERAVFLLKESFDYSYQEIAKIIHKTPDNCRQLCHRAKQRIKSHDHNISKADTSTTSGIQQQQ